MAVGAHARLAVALAAAAAVLAAGGSAVSGATPVGTPVVTEVVTRVVPSSLARGADPAVVHLVRDTIRDGDRRVPATRRGEHEALWAVAGGYLLRDFYVGPRQLARVVFIDPAGERRVVARSRDWIDVAVSADGTRMALGESSSSTGIRRVVTVLRTRDGRVLARRELRLTRVVAVTRRAVLLGRGLDARSPTTQWWDHRRDRLRTIHDQKAFRADVPHDRVVFAAGREDSFCNRVAVLSRPDRTLWRSCRFYPHQWSPDGRRALATWTYFDAAGTDRWWLVDGHTGAREARFVGRLGWDAVWEDDRHFLTAAQGEDGTAALVRCDVAGACERASRLWDVPIPPDPSTFYAGPPVLLAQE